MINPVIEDRIYSSYSNIGAIICHTPKTVVYSYKGEDGNDVSVDHRCELINSVQELLDYYGDPFIDPVKYCDLIIAYHLVSNGHYMYISSIDDDMLNTYEENFRTPYNGHTEFSFVNSGYDTVGYRLKSDIKFCQPIIRAKFAINRLDLYVDLYILNRSLIQGDDALRTFSKANLYKTNHYVFDTSKKDTTDQLLIDTLLKDGLELQVVNSDPSKETSLIDEFKACKNLVIYFESYDEHKEKTHEAYDLTKIERNTKSEHYWYRINSDKYIYDFDDEDKASLKYIEAIERLSEKKPEPHNLLLSKIYKSFTIKNDSGLVVRSVLDDMSYDSVVYIQSSLLELFPSDCYTYCYLNTPDISSSSIVDFLNGINSSPESDAENDHHIALLPENYNCDLYYGAISDFVVGSTILQVPNRVHFPLASIAFYNIVRSSSVYSANPVDDLNISNNNIKFIVSESIAESLRDLRCNTLVSFDSDKPTIYGNRTLSLLPNLRFSHIARNFVRMRRSIHEFLETKKFMLNTYYNINNCLNYIKSQILEQYIESGILSNYNIDYTTEHQTVTINVRLVFARALESINLEFTI